MAEVSAGFRMYASAFMCGASAISLRRNGGRDSNQSKRKMPRNTARHFELAEWTGLEPATPGVTGRYSNQLNYHSMNRSETTN